MIMVNNSAGTWKKTHFIQCVPAAGILYMHTVMDVNLFPVVMGNHPYNSEHTKQHNILQCILCLHKNTLRAQFYILAPYLCYVISIQ